MQERYLARSKKKKILKNMKTRNIKIKRGGLTFCFFSIRFELFIKKKNKKSKAATQ
jgi:hypothetical protein